MTIDEAIKHCLEVAEEQSRLYSLCPCPCDGTDNCMSLRNGKDMGCTKHATDYRQLAEWLMDYKDLKAEQNEQYTFIRELMDELKEAKRLLKAAMEDMKMLYEAGKDEGCVGIEFKWRYADDALKLIGDDANE